MTKNVRIENADTSNHKLVVEVWETRDGMDQLMDTKQLNHPADMVTLAVWVGGTCW